MDDARFDALARSLTTTRSRRSLARLLGGLSLGGVASALATSEVRAALRVGGMACTGNAQCKTGRCVGPTGSKKCTCSADFPACKQPANPCKKAVCDTGTQRCLTRNRADLTSCGGGQRCSGGVCATPPGCAMGFNCAGPNDCCSQSCVCLDPPEPCGTHYCAGGATGLPCNGDNDCLSEKCVGFVCQ